VQKVSKINYETKRVDWKNIVEIKTEASERDSIVERLPSPRINEDMKFKEKNVIILYMI